MEDIKLSELDTEGQIYRIIPAMRGTEPSNSEAESGTVTAGAGVGSSNLFTEHSAVWGDGMHTGDECWCWSHSHMALLKAAEYLSVV